MPFNPKDTITGKIKNNLTRIMSMREIIERACLSPELDKSTFALADVKLYK
jgi:hypothetical protein